MFVVMKNGAVWGYYDTQAEAIAAIEEERGKEDGVELVMIDEEEATVFGGWIEVKGGIEEAEPLAIVIERILKNGRDL